MTQKTALKILETGVNVFLTGEPGAGKSHTVREYVERARGRELTVALTASTGIAATHIGGMTIHAWSGLGIRKSITRAECQDLASNATVRRRVKGAQVLIIDEISMLDAGMLEALDLICRVLRDSNEPFGGVQLVLVGDFFQLPPVTRAGEAPARFAFEARAWQAANLTVCYLSEQHRQEDASFLELLGAIRRGLVTDGHLELLEKRRRVSKNEEITKLFSHNADVDRINTDHLRTLTGKERTYTMTTYGSAKIVEALKKGCLSPEVLKLKVGARVMLTRNSPAQGFVNGSLGVVKGFDPEATWPVVELLSGKTVTVEPEMWSAEGDGASLAAIRQVPLRLAWAITVHKSQGMSLDGAFIDLSGAFAYGQGYVALSRVRSLKGLFLGGLNTRALAVDPVVLEKDSEFRAASEAAAREAVNLPDSVKLAPRPASARKVKAPRWTETLALINEGQSIQVVALVRARTVGTILEHLEEARTLNLLTPAVVKGLKKEGASLVGAVGPVFKKQTVPGLKPVFEHFQGMYSYDELKIAEWLLSL
jgi:ATP-dependent DNA helicase PIF1